MIVRTNKDLMQNISLKIRQNCISIIAKLPEYMILFKDIFTFLRLDTKNAFKHHIYRKIISCKNLLSEKLKWTYELSSNDYRVGTLSKSYLTVTGIIIQSLK